MRGKARVPPDIPAEMQAALAHPEVRVILVLGATDTGKTAWVAASAALCAAAGPVAILDLDAGQSHIGPPTTLGWGIIEGGFPGWDRIVPEGLYFTGSTSPAGNLLGTVLGARLMLDGARAHCPKVLVDTTGLVAGDLGRTLKQAKIELLRPDLVVALERGSELAGCLEAVRGGSRPRVVRVQPGAAVRRKGEVERRRHREEMYRRHFEGAHVLRLPLRGAIGGGIRGERLADRQILEAALGTEVPYALHSGDLLWALARGRWSRAALPEAAKRMGACRLVVYPWASLIHRLAGLYDGEGHLVSVARVTGFDPEGEALLLRAPGIGAADEERISGIRLGRVRVNSAGRELSSRAAPFSFDSG